MSWLQALGSSLAPTIAVIVGRWMSNREHRQTAQQVEDIHAILNGKPP